MGTINSYLSDHGIKVRPFFAAISEYVGFTIASYDIYSSSSSSRSSSSSSSSRSSSSSSSSSKSSSSSSSSKSSSSSSKSSSSSSRSSSSSSSSRSSSSSSSSSSRSSSSSSKSSSSSSSSRSSSSSSSGSPLTFWYHRYSSPPDYAVEVTALSKGMIPIFNILNSTYSGYANQQTNALNFQSNNNNCTIAMVQHFWGQSVTSASAWDTDGVWLDYITKRLSDTSNRIMMIDVEPPDVDPTENSIMDQWINKQVDGKYGVAGSAEQQEAATDFVEAQEKFQYALPDLRNIDPYTVPTTPGSLYAILPALGIRRINEATYPPTGDFSTILLNDVIGLRVRIDGTGSSYTPAAAKEAWPGRDKMYFPVYTTEATAAINLGDFSLAAAEEVEMMALL